MTLRLVESWRASAGAAQGDAGSLALLSELGYFFRPNFVGTYTIPGIGPGPLANGNCIEVSYGLTGGFFDAPDLVMPLGGGATVSGAVMGMPVWLGADATLPAYFGLWDASGGEPQVSVAFCPMGVVQAWRGFPGSGVLLGSSEIGAFNCDAWFYAELKAVISETDGTVEVRINTVDTAPAVSVVSANTQATGRALIDGIVMGAMSGLGTVRYKFGGYYVCDLTGSVNNSFLGNSMVQGLLVSGAGSMTDFSRSNPAITNWQCALNQNVDDTLYVFDSAAGDGDLYTVQPLVNNPTVFGVQVKGAYRQTDATQRFVKNQLKASGTLVRGASTPTDLTYAFVKDVWELNPGTGLAFTGPQVNAAEIGPYLDV